MNTPNQLIEAAKKLVHDVNCWTQPINDHGRETIAESLGRVNAAIEASTQDDWQEISSAPKDGTRVQLWRSPWKNTSQGYCLDDRSPDNEGWFTTGSHIRIEPTHWMPLPNPPTAQPDEQVCRFNCRDGIIYGANPALDGHQPCPACQPVPPSEGEVAAKEPRFFEQGFWIHDREDGPGSMARMAVDHPTQRSLVIDALNALAATNPTPEGPKPTGTIFELDLYARERLERLANCYEPTSPVAQMIRGIASDLRPLIDNVQKQYVHTASPESDGVRAFVVAAKNLRACFASAVKSGEPWTGTLETLNEQFTQKLAAIEGNTPTPSPPTPPTGDCDACGKTFAADDLTFRAYGEGGNHVADGSFCPDCNGTPLDPPPTELHIDPQNQEGVELADNFDSVSGEVAARNLAARLNASPPTEGGAEGPFRAGDFVGGKLLRSDAWASIANAAYAAGASSTNQKTFDHAHAIGYAKGLHDGEGASSRGSGEAAGHLVEELRRLAEVVRVADTQPAAIDLRGAASDITAVACQLAQNPSRGSELGDCSKLPSLGNGDSPLEAILEAATQKQGE